MKFKSLRGWFAAVTAVLSLSSWAAGTGTGTLTLRDAFGPGTGGWKLNVSAMEVHVPLVVVDVAGRAIEGFDATLQLGGEGGFADAGYKLNASGKMVETTWWGTLNQSIFHLVGRQQLQQSNGAVYNFDHAEISTNGGASWNTVFCDTPSCVADPRRCMDICCQSCSSSDWNSSYGWRAYDTYGNIIQLWDDNHTVQIKTVYRLAPTEKSYGTLTLVDGFEREWKASVARATTVHVPLEFYDTASNPIEDHYDATFELGGTSGNGNAGYVLNANEGIVETDWWGPMNQSLFYLVGRRKWRAADNTCYVFDHAEISMDGGESWNKVYTDTPTGAAYPRQLMDFCCYDCSNESYSADYGWKFRSTTGNEIFIDNDGHSMRLRLFYRPTLLGDAYTIPTLDAAKTGITFRLFDYTDDVNSAANGLEGYFNFRANTMDTSVYRNYINENTDADGFTPAHATVLPTLVDGYPVFSGTRNGIRYCDDKSLRYLFDGEAHGVGVTEYPVANTPLILQSDGSYAYDSRVNACDYDEERHLLLVRNYVERTSAAAESSSSDPTFDYYDFLPFAHWDGMTWKTYTSGSFPRQYQYEKENTAYWFGYTMEYDFTTPAANVADSIFTFSGDDDVWVFIDDVLVLDLGGTHGMCTGTIDFKTGNVTAHIDWLGDQSSYSYPTTIKAQFDKAGQTYVDREEWIGNTFRPNTPHHLKMFYLERGGAVANCNVRFSMAVTPEVFTMPKSLWIADHRDAGEGAVFLAFHPIFDEEIELRGWIEKANAEKRIKVAFGKTPEQIETAAATVAPLRAPDGQQDVDNGWVWIAVTMPEAGVDAEGLLWKVVIDGMPDRDVNEDAVEKVSINEIMAKNGETFATVNGTKGLDWIELRNDGDSAVDVAGWYLSDNPDKKQSKWAKIEGSAVVPAHGTLIVWADKDFDGFSEREAFTRIGLSEDGEALFLADRFGEVKTRIDFPAQIKDVSYGVASNGSGAWGYFSAPTPNARNGATVAEDITPPVVFSEPHGYKTAPVTVAISCPSSPEAEIRYTTDGSFPTAQSSLYDRERPIRIDRTTCLRAAVVNDNSILQQDNSATYIFLDDVLSEQASSAAPAGFPADRAVNNHRMVYGLNLPAEGTEDRARLLRGFTNSIATISFVVDPHALFDSTTGIYVNPDPANEGEAWERRIMLEQIDPKEQIADPAQERNGFTVPAGLRLRGAHSRTVDYPKHSFRLFFRGKYGAGALKFPLFGSEGADKFQKVDLRTSQNYSWANEAAEGDTFVHETFERDTQRALGVYYTRSRYYHLFINGRYWGLYQTQERGDEDFAETYDKGDAANYDVVKTSTAGGQRAFGASEGTIDAWSNLWHVVVNEGVDGDKAANYWRLQGLDPDGTRNPAYPILLNPYNLMAYLLVGHFTVDGDCPVSVWGGFPNNIYAVRNRVDSDSKNPGFFFLRHDGELCMGTSTVETRLPYEDYRRTYSYCSNDPTLWGTEAYSADYATFAKFNPAELHWRLCRNPDYRLAFADVFYRECLKAGGALTAPVAKARFESRMAEIDSAIVCEAARWARNGQTRATWAENCAKCLAFIEERIPYLLAQYRARGWYPSIDAPTIAVANGEATFTAVHPVYYTLDGSDPRTNGTLAPEGGVALPETGTTVIRARCTSSTEWSAQNEETFVGRDE